jgi:hypothetical protein
MPATAAQQNGCMQEGNREAASGQHAGAARGGSTRTILYCTSHLRIDVLYSQIDLINKDGLTVLSKHASAVCRRWCEGPCPRGPWRVQRSISDFNASFTDNFFERSAVARRNRQPGRPSPPELQPTRPFQPKRATSNESCAWQAAARDARTSRFRARRALLFSFLPAVVPWPALCGGRSRGRGPGINLICSGVPGLRLHVRLHVPTSPAGCRRLFSFVRLRPC